MVDNAKMEAHETNFRKLYFPPSIGRMNMITTTERMNGTSTKPTSKPAKATPVRKPAKAADTMAVWVAMGAATTTVLFSMVLNVRAFTEHTDDVWFGTALGVMVPLWVLCATYLGKHSKDVFVRRFAYTLAGFMLLVSLPHLAAGYAKLGLQPYEGWALAIVTDLTQVMCKLVIVKQLAK